MPSRIMNKIHFPIHQNYLRRICMRTFEYRVRRNYTEDSTVFGFGKHPSAGDVGLSNSRRACTSADDDKKTYLINAYRRFGYLNADLDPLKIFPRIKSPECNPSFYSSNDHEQFTEPLLESSAASFNELVHCLDRMYCGQISIEFMHLTNINEREWFAEKYEGFIFEQPIDPSEQINSLKIMLKAKAWEEFLAQKFPTLKRYSGEGAESAVAFYRCLMELSPNFDIQQFIFSGAHRGRLALQTILFNFSVSQLFRKIRGMQEFPDGLQGMGDVLTHQHSHFSYKTLTGYTFHVSTLPNPSHLEACLPVAIGKSRGKAMSTRTGDYSDNGRPGDGILCVQHHGDAAFTGQGVVWETLNLSQVPHFRIGGCIHLIVNNQVGYTADRTIGRSSMHASDMAKAIDSPVIHVNGDSVDNCIRASKLALAYWYMFRKDVFVNLLCYRKHGHNELDEPTFTNPLMYEIIKSKIGVVDEYGEKLHNEGIFARSEADNYRNEYISHLNSELELVDTGKSEPWVDHLRGSWQGYQQAPSAVQKWDTGLDLDFLSAIGLASVSYPDSFNIHPTVKRAHADARLKRFSETPIKIDWSTAESLAFGSILMQGFDVRLSGQDVGRGTFSQRHAMFIDQKTDRVYIPLNSISPEQYNFLEIANSPLSEAAVLGFEYGISIENPRRLVIWEAQFGDFYNSGQVQIDTLIASGESKWLHQNGIVLLLPHGFDGAGPDHSSSHIERFLQLTESRESVNPPDGDNVNMFVVNPTTSSQYFHLLRRQIVTPYRKPIIIASPKLLLRHSATSSDFSEFAPGTSFSPVLVDQTLDPSKIKKLVFSCGKHVITLQEAIRKLKITDTAIISVEQLCPFPVHDLESAIKRYSNATKFVWSQEEPKNAGAWSFVKPRMKNAFGIEVRYAGRPEFAWIATAIGDVHKLEIENIMDNTFK